MSITRPVTQLDFDALKAEIISFIKGNPTFSDYNFEGSALNAIADLLAFNTHNNAYYANMVHSESFLDTAQKRQSIVSRAKEMGYTPRSAVCSTAFLDIVTSGASIDTQINIPRGTSFRASNDNGSYDFYVVNSSIGVNSGLNKVFDDLKIVSGSPASNFFMVDTQSNIRSLFTIPNPLIDTSTLKVFVRDSLNAVERVEYFKAENAFELDSNSKVYFLQEGYDGSFQIFFGDNVIGKQPINGNRIDIDYFVADKGTLPNDCRQFGFEGTIGAVTNIGITTTQVSFGGAGKEELDSIKFNAGKSNSAKERSVSSLDYSLSLRENFPFIHTVSVWGGEDNVPPVYGKVFVSIQPVSGYTISDQIKRDVITPLIRKNSIMTVGVEYVDPTYLEMYFDTTIKLDTSKTILTTSEISGLVKSVISDYVASISTFNKDYLESGLVSKISLSDPGIQSVNLSKNVGFKIAPLLGLDTAHNKIISNPIKSGSVSSTLFKTVWNGAEHIVAIKETGSVDSVGNAKLGLYTEDGMLVRDIGYVNLSSGKFSMTLNVLSYINFSRFVGIQFSLVSDDVYTSRNQILKMARTQESSSGINYNNVIVQTYDKQ